MTAWSEILLDLERDPLSTADRLDWTAKYRLIEQFRASESIPEQDPWLRSLDLSYHALDRKEGLFYGLLESGAMRLPFPLADITENGWRAPRTTRAALRGGCIEKFGALVESAQWEAVILRGATHRIEVDLRDVFTRAEVELGLAALANAQVPENLLSLPFAKLR